MNGGHAFRKQRFSDGNCMCMAVGAIYYGKQFKGTRDLAFESGKKLMDYGVDK